MIGVNVSITHLSAERFLDIRKPFPPMHINTNLSLTGMEKKLDSLEVTFIVTINYDPSVAQVSLKGKAYVTGDKSEIEKLYKEYEERKPYPPVIMQAISNVVSIEAIVITTKTLNIPPPIPLPQIPAMAGKAPDKKTPVMDYSA